MTAKTVTAAVFNGYDADLQKLLLSQGYVVLNEEGKRPNFPAAVQPAPQQTGPVVADDLLGEDAPEPESSDLWLNVDLDVKGKARRILGQSLDFALYRSKEDREAGKEDALIRSLINTIQKHGVEKCNESMTFTVTITKKGESGVSADTDLLA